MNNQEYKDKAKRTLPDLGLDKDQLVRIVSEEIGLKLNLSHVLLGLSSELEELASCVGTELSMDIDSINLKEELGDLYWYLANYCNIRNISVPLNPFYTEPDEECFEVLIKNIGILNDVCKKHIAYGQNINEERELKAIYGIYTALLMFENLYDIEGEEIRNLNINKLIARYPHKFEESLATNRDLNKERNILEGNNEEDKELAK